MKYARVLKGFLVPRWEFNGYLRHIKELIQILVYPCQFQWVNLRYKRRAEIFVYVSLISLYVKSFFNCALLFQWTILSSCEITFILNTLLQTVQNVPNLIRLMESFTLSHFLHVTWSSISSKYIQSVYVAWIYILLKHFGNDKR